MSAIHSLPVSQFIAGVTISHVGGCGPISTGPANVTKRLRKNHRSRGRRRNIFWRDMACAEKCFLHTNHALAHQTGLEPTARASIALHRERSKVPKIGASGSRGRQIVRVVGWACCPKRLIEISANYFLRCRIFARIRRFLRPTLRRPLPVLLVPT